MRAQGAGGWVLPVRPWAARSHGGSPVLEGSARSSQEDAGQGWGKADAALRTWQEDPETGFLTSRLLSDILSVT